MWGIRRGLFPRKLLADTELYIAALNPDPVLARNALRSWATGKTGEDLTFFKHKLVARLEERFLGCVSDLPIYPAWRSIHRLRALQGAANFQEFQKTVLNSDIHLLDVVVLGELHERVVLTDTPRDGLDCIELGVARPHMQKLSEILCSGGARAASAPATNPIGKLPFTPLLFSSGLPVRLIGMNTPLSSQPWQFGLKTLDREAYLSFLGSRPSAFLARRDQYIFSLAALFNLQGVRKAELGQARRLLNQKTQKILGIAS
jgi:hypothetical protein